MANKNILIALCGTSPAVISEAIWALATQKTPLNKVVIITTELGKEKIKEQLFGKENTIQKLKDELNNKFGQEYSNFKFSQANKFIHIIPNHNETQNSTDIINSDDTLTTSNFILEIVRQQTIRKDNKVIFSIAGGRKSMTAIGALCMTLLGRDQDQLCHILVNEPYENFQLTPKFYFPSKQKHTLNNKTYLGTDAKITLAKIPYIRVRKILTN